MAQVARELVFESKGKLSKLIERLERQAIHTAELLCIKAVVRHDLRKQLIEPGQLMPP